MKTALFLTLSFLSIANLNAQEIYIPGKIAQGEKVTYRCKDLKKLYLEVENVNNTDTTRIIYYEDGSIVPDYESERMPAKYIHSQEDLIRVFQEALTPEEWQKIKGKSGYGLFLWLVADSSGNTKELKFVFRSDDPVLTKFTPDRLFQLEERFKEVIKLNWYKSAKRMRNVKYAQSIHHRQLD